jgi:hypothetical protein
MTLAPDVYGLGGYPVHDVGLRSKPRRAQTAEAGGGRRRRRQSADRVAGEERIVKIHRKSGRQPPPPLPFSPSFSPYPWTNQGTLTEGEGTVQLNSLC